MKIAIFACLDFRVPGGAERFFIDMATALDATIVCLSVDTHLCELYPAARNVHFHPLNRHLPGEPLRQLLGMHLFRSLKLSYDLSICTDDMALRFLSRKGAHIYYLLTPRRAFYDMYYETLSDLPLGKRMVFQVVLPVFRSLDRRFVKSHVKNIACISHNVRSRILRSYQKDATVLYPPIHIEEYRCISYGDFWLAVSRVDKWKRIDVIVEAFRQMPEKKLKIAGKIYPGFERLVQSSPENVEFLGMVDDQHLQRLYGECRGFITMAIDEDYGLTPLEAMASGKAVIAAAEGGYLETVVNGHTGYFVSPTVPEICNAVALVDRDPAKFGDECRKQAEKFDYKIFKEELNTYVKRLFTNREMETV